MHYVIFKVMSELWLVDSDLVTEPFREAVKAANETYNCGVSSTELNEDQSRDFLAVLEDPNTKVLGP